MKHTNWGQRQGTGNAPTRKVEGGYWKGKAHVTETKPVSCRVWSLITQGLRLPGRWKDGVCVWGELHLVSCNIQLVNWVQGFSVHPRGCSLPSELVAWFSLLSVSLRVIVHSGPACPLHHCIPGHSRLQSSGELSQKRQDRSFSKGTLTKKGKWQLKKNKQMNQMKTKYSV